MMRRILIISLGLLAMISGVAWMQAPTADTGGSASGTVTVTPLEPGAIKTATPTPLPAKPEDPRPEVCSAPYQEGWEAHIVKAGDTLGSLMEGISELSVAQAAGLNCIDDPSALPVGFGSMAALYICCRSNGRSLPAACQIVDWRGAITGDSGRAAVVPERDDDLARGHPRNLGYHQRQHRFTSV